MADSRADDTTHFGFSRVKSSEKATLVRGVFDRVADQYDVMNDLMSAGMHRVWKDHFVRVVAPCSGMHILDLASGTGDIAFKLINTIQNQRQVATDSARTGGNYDDGECSRIIATDINGAMLEVGQRRAVEIQLNTANIDLVWLQVDAESIPLPDACVDAVTIVFGLRNVTNPLNALREARRVLRRGGRFLCMEFAEVRHPALRQLYDEYSLKVIPAIGAAVVGDAQPYQYLVESIRAFPKQAEVKDMMRTAGFKSVSHEDLVQGAVAIYSGFHL